MIQQSSQEYKHQHLHLQEKSKTARHEAHPKQSAVLVVEDDPDIGGFIKDLLVTEREYQVLLVQQGAAALEAVKSVRPQLILLDYQLPGLNGLQIYKYLHEDKSTRDIPVILMSAYLNSHGELENQGLEYLRKPFEIDDLLEKVDKVLNRKWEAA